MGAKKIVLTELVSSAPASSPGRKMISHLIDGDFLFSFIGDKMTCYSLLRLPEVLKARGISKSSFYAEINDGLWTKPVAASERSVAWPCDETDLQIGARIASMSTDEIRKLVADLHAKRNDIRMEVLQNA